MGRITDAFKDQIKDRVPVSRIAEKHVEMKRAGRDMVGISPWTNEKTPSFYVMDQKQFFKCFSSNKAGDVITLIMDLEGLSFMEAIKTLAEMAGLEMPEYNEAEKRRDTDRQLLSDAVNDAQEYFSKCLFAEDGSMARDYLKSRNMGRESALKWGLGFAPADFNAIPNVLKKHSEEILIKAGLIKSNSRGSFGFFRNRLTIPIRDRRGRIVSFGARSLDPNGKPKYLNGPATDLFDKSRTLYGADIAKDAVAKDRSINGLILSEGYLDVMAFARAGINHSVAPLGTSVAESHLTEIWRYGPEPIICLDGDSAGQRAALKVAEMALPRIGNGRSVFFAQMPKGMDPDDILRQRGPDALKAIIKSPISMPKVLFDHERSLEDLNTPERRAGFRHRLDEHLKRITDKETAHHYKQMFYEWTRKTYRRGGKEKKSEELKSGSLVGHRGLGVLVRCIDNPGLFSAADEFLVMADNWGNEAKEISSVALDLYRSGIDVNREVIIDTLLVDMKTEAADALEGFPKGAEISEGSVVWDSVLHGLRKLQSDPAAPASLADAIKQRKSQ